MIRYETLILTVPEITADETSNLEQQFEQLLKKAQGSLRSFERWGKYRLAYSVWGHEYGVYFLVRFEFESARLETQLFRDIQALFTVKFPTLVMRHMTTRLAQNQPLNYVKPESLEDIPSEGVDNLLKEGKKFLYPNQNSVMENQESVEEHQG